MNILSASMKAQNDMSGFLIIRATLPGASLSNYSMFIILNSFRSGYLAKNLLRFSLFLSSTIMCSSRLSPKSKRVSLLTFWILRLCSSSWKRSVFYLGGFKSSRTTFLALWISKYLATVFAIWFLSLLTHIMSCIEGCIIVYLSLSM